MERKYTQADHSVYLCDYHLVFATKYRRNLISNEGIWEHLKQKFFEVTEHYPRLFIKEINHDINHIHILISIPPQSSVGSVVRLLKTNSSRNIKTTFPFIAKLYYGTDGIWSDGYFVSTVGVDERTIKRYIENQGIDDMGRTATLFD
jgi:putative transposase